MAKFVAQKFKMATNAEKSVIGPYGKMKIFFSHIQSNKMVCEYSSNN